MKSGVEKLMGGQWPFLVTLKRKTLKSILEGFQISAKDFMRLKKGK